MSYCSTIGRNNMPLTISGKLSLPITGHPASNAQIRFRAVSSAGEIISGAESIVKCDTGGNYTASIEFSRYELSTRISTPDFVIHGQVTIDSGTIASDLEDLIALIGISGTLTDDLIRQFEILKGEAEAAAARAEAAAASIGDGVYFMSSDEFEALRAANSESHLGTGVLFVEKAPSGTKVVYGNSVKGGLYELNPLESNKFGMTEHVFLIDWIQFNEPAQKITFPEAPSTAVNPSEMNFAYFWTQKNEANTATTEFNAAKVRYYDRENNKFVYYTTGVETLAVPDGSTLESAFTVAGYTKTSNSPGYLFSNGTRNATSLFLVGRLSQGCFHEFYNPEGCANVQGLAGENDKWYNTDRPITSRANCFQYALNGSISSASSGRYDHYKYYDGIYEGRVFDCRISSRIIRHDAKEISMTSAFNGSMRGSGKLTFLQTFANNAQVSTGTTNGVVTIAKSNILGKNDYVDGLQITNDNQPWVYHHEGDRAYKLLSFRANGSYMDFILSEQQSGGRLENIPSGSHWSLCVGPDLSSECDSLPYVDIIGSPERIAATIVNMGSDGMLGSWVPVIPDGTQKVYGLTLKANEPSGRRLITRDNGLNWAFTSTLTLDGVLNKINTGSSTIPSDQVQIIQYLALSAQTQPAAQLPIMGKPETVFSGCFNQISYGNRLISSLTGLIAKNGDTTKGVNKNLDVKGFSFDSSRKLALSSGWGGKGTPSHEPIDFGSPQNDSPALKTMYNTVIESGLIYLQFNYVELHYDSSGTSGNEWGDTVAGTTYTAPYGKIPIKDNDDTTIDLNGTVVKCGTHRSKFPIGIANYNNDAQAVTITKPAIKMFGGYYGVYHT